MDIDRLRSLLPVTRSHIYMNTGSSGPCPTPTVEAVCEMQRWLSAEGPSGPNAWARMHDAEGRARQAVADVLGCQPAEIALTHSTSEGISIVLNGLGLGPGDEVIITDIEHDSVLVPVYHLCQRVGATWRMLMLSGGIDPVAALAEVISPRVRLVAVSHVAFCNGQMLPIPEMAAVAREAGVPLLVDGAQGPGHVPVNVKEMGVAFYAAPGQKWLLGPEGTGALYVSEEWRDRVTPAWLGWASHSGYDLLGNYSLKPDARRYEVGTRDPAALMGLAESVAVLRSIGLESIHARILALSDMLRDRLRQMPRVNLRSPSDGPARTGLVAFTVEGVQPPDVVRELYSRARVVCRSIPPPFGQVVRVSVNAFQTEEELDVLCECLAAL